MNNYQHEKNISKWLKKIRVDPKFLSDTDIDTEFLIAQIMAEELLKNWLNYLDKHQNMVLVLYLKSLKNKKEREKMALKRAYQVMQIHNKVNRLMFKKIKQLNTTEE